MKDWKTTVCGVIAAIGAILQEEYGWVGTVGKVMVAGGLAALGNFAADSKK